MRTPEAKTTVDTGFIVFNNRNYPLLTSLFSQLGVEVQKSDMSFGISIDDGKVEYRTIGLLNIFVQKSNILKFRFLQMIKDILRFNAKALDDLECHGTITLTSRNSALKLRN